MTASEVQPGLKTLRNQNIPIVALHNHVIGEEPAFCFTHDRGRGSAEELATAVRAAIDAQQAVEDAHGQDEVHDRRKGRR